MMPGLCGSPPPQVVGTVRVCMCVCVCVCVCTCVCVGGDGWLCVYVHVCVCVCVGGRGEWVAVCVCVYLDREDLHISDVSTQFHHILHSTHCTLYVSVYEVRPV